MTDQRNPSEKSELIDLIDHYQEILNRQVNAALESQEMDDQTYIWFMSEECSAETTNGVYDHFGQLFSELAEYHRDRLHQRILKGAEILDEMNKDDPRYSKYMRLYDSLVEKLRESEG